MNRFRSLSAGALALAAACAPALAQYQVDFVKKRPFPVQIVNVPTGTGDEIRGDLRGMDVNTTPGHPQYGWVYIADKTGIGAGQPFGRIRIYKPNPEAARNGAPFFQDTGLLILVNSSTSQFASYQGPMGVSVSDDGLVYINDFSERQIEVAPAIPPNGEATVTAEPLINLPDFDAEAGPMLPDGTWTVGHPRNVHVAGPSTDLTVIVTNNTADGSQTDQTIQKFRVTEDGGSTTVAHAWTRGIAPAANTHETQGGTGYDATTDHLGNVYVPLRADAGQATILKYSPDGALLDTPAFLAPTGTGPTGASHPGGNQPGIAFVRDPSVAGGGYLWWSGRVSNGVQPIYRYDLQGNLLDGLGGWFGTPSSPGNVLGYMEADDTGNLIVRLGNTSTSANMMLIVKTPRYVTDGGALKSSPTVFNGIAYFGGQDGKVYGVDSATGAAAPGFPVDIAGLAGDPAAAVLSRMNVRYDGTAFHLYFTTSNGRVGRLPLNGDTSPASGYWLTQPLVAGATEVNVTPAADLTGVYVALAGTAGASLFALDPATGTIQSSQGLPGASAVRSSPSAFSGNVYFGTDAGVYRAVAVGNVITPMASIGAATAGSPFVDMLAPGGPAMFVADNTGVVYARNAVNFSPLAAFNGGSVTLTDGVNPAPAVSGGPYVFGGRVYIGAEDNKVYVLNASDGTGAGPAGSMVFFDAGPATPSGIGIPAGMSAAPSLDGGMNIVFGSRNGLYYQVDAQDPSVYRVVRGKFAPQDPAAGEKTLEYGAPFSTAPGIDGAGFSEFIGSDDGRVYNIPRF